MAEQNAKARRAYEVHEEGASDTSDIDSLMRRFFEQGRSDTAAAPQTDVANQPKQPRRDFDTACDLLEHASRAFEVLLTRCERLEQELEEVQERAKVQAQQQDDTCQQWRKLAEGMQGQVVAADQNLKALQAHCDAIEARAAAAEARGVQLEKELAQTASHAEKADVLSTKLHDKVVTAFGIGSRAHAALQAIVTETPAKA